MYVKRALIAALEPPFYRDGLLQHTRAVSPVGEPLQQGARALVSHYGRPLQHRAAARGRAALFIHTAVDCYSTAAGCCSTDFSPWRTAAANRCSISVRYIIFLTPAHRYSRLLQRTRAGAAVDGCSILSSGQRCSRPLQHAWLALAHRALFSYAGVVCCSTRQNSRLPPGERQLPICCEQFSDLLRSYALVYTVSHATARCSAVIALTVLLCDVYQAPRCSEKKCSAG